MPSSPPHPQRARCPSDPRAPAAGRGRSRVAKVPDVVQGELLDVVEVVPLLGHRGVVLHRLQAGRGAGGRSCPCRRHRAWRRPRLPAAAACS